MLNKGDILQNRYRILDRLGEGGMGAVYQAEDAKRFNKAVALKEVLLDLSNTNSEHLRRAFEREAKILTQIEHEAVPKVIDYFLETNCQFLVMELIEGDDLTNILQKRRTWFPLENVLNWANQLLDALDYLHGLKPPIIHRDIKPQNLKLTSRGKIKLLDFGIAKDTGAELSATMTDHTFIGATLHYSPFEQIIRLPFYYEPLRSLYGEKIEVFLRQSADARSDIYSLGATLYHLLTNVEPLGAYQRTLEVWSGKYDPLPPPHKLVSHISPEISAFLLKALELDRENRFSSANEMKTALQEIIWDEKRREYEEDQSILLDEQERLQREREEIELERERLKIEQAESMRMIAAERERGRSEKEETHEQELLEAESKRLAAIEFERRRSAEDKKKELELERLEAEREEALRQLVIERKHRLLEEEKNERERQRLAEEEKIREQKRLEEEAEKEREREELEAERRRLEAEKRWLKVQHEESLRQIAAERERVQLEEKEKSRELQRLETERRRIEAERQRLEAEEQERERLRLEEEKKKEIERQAIEGERQRLEAERLRLEAEEKERQQKLFAEEERIRREREELEEKRRLEAERVEQQRQLAAELERQRLEKEQELEKQKLAEEEKERERQRLAAAEKEREQQRLAAAEKERLRLAEEARELQRIEAEKERIEKENEQRRLAEVERELEGAFEAIAFNPLETIADIPADKPIEAGNAAQVSPFITQIETQNFDAAEKDVKTFSTELFQPLNSGEVELRESYPKEIEAESEKPETAPEFDGQEIVSEKESEASFESEEIIIKCQNCGQYNNDQSSFCKFCGETFTPVTLPAAEVDNSSVPFAAAGAENSFIPQFSSAPPKKPAWILPVAALVILLFGIAAVGMWMMSGNSESGNTNTSVTNTEAVLPNASPSLAPSASPANEPTPVPTETVSNKSQSKPTVAPTQVKAPTQAPVKTPPPVKTPKPTQDPNCVFTNSCK